MTDSQNLSLPFPDYLKQADPLSKRTPIKEILSKIVGAEIPVPDYLRDRRKELLQIRQTKLSQKIGILSYLASMGAEQPGVLLRLQKLQSIATLEAIQSALKFQRNLELNPKLVSDFRHIMFYFLSTNYRLAEPKKFPHSRIRGYRDKGTLPDKSRKARNRAQEEGWLDLRSLEKVSVQEFLKTYLPDSLFEEDCLYLPGAFEYLQEEKEVLRRLEQILSRL